jgi:hypothetical protein
VNTGFPLRESSANTRINYTVSIAPRNRLVYKIELGQSDLADNAIVPSMETNIQVEDGNLE